MFYHLKTTCAAQVKLLPYIYYYCYVYKLTSGFIAKGHIALHANWIVIYNSFIVQFLSDKTVQQ